MVPVDENGSDGRIGRMEYPLRMLEKNEWPRLIFEMSDPPKKLYVRGSLGDPEHKTLSIVGSRAATTYGKEVTKKLVAGLRSYPITIVSGLAIGIDSCAHEAALDAGLHTISVPGSGINDDVIYPARNKHLARRILESGGALLSEFEPDFHATAWSFPTRNRIMAGMSHAVLVIEARERSGTLITSRLATDYNRDVLTVPGSIFSESSEGPHMLIRLGATPVTTSRDILEALHFDIDTEEKGTPVDLSSDEQKLYTLLTEPLSRDELVRRCGLPTSSANVIIALLELKEAITEFGGQIRRI